MQNIEPFFKTIMPSLLHKARPGRSAIKIIVTLVILAAVGYGGYIGYTQYLAPALNPYNGIMPEGMEQYAVGENADAILVFKMDETLTSTLKKMYEPNGKNPEDIEKIEKYLNQFKGAVMLIKQEQLTSFAALGFSDEETAQSVATEIKKYLSTSSVPVQIEQEGTNVVIEFGGGLPIFTGSLYNNPLLKNIDPEMKDSQFIASINNQLLIEANGIFRFMSGPLFDSSPDFMESLLPTAHAQASLIDVNSQPTSISSESPEDSLWLTGLSSSALMKNMVLYGKVTDMHIELHTKLNFLEKSELASSEMEPAYDQIMPALEKIVPEIQKVFDAEKQKLANFEGTIDFSDNTVTVAIKYPLEVIIKATREAPIKARDAARKANLNSFIAALETYNNDKQKYPAKSGCVESLTEIAPYFSGAKIPSDPLDTPQTFGSVTCENGYYYQNLNGEAYILWAKMEMPENGNSIKTPQDLAKMEVNDIIEKKNPSQSFISVTNITYKTAAKDGGGNYFIILKDIAPIKTSATQQTQETEETKSQTQQVKVPRTTNP